MPIPYTRDRAVLARRRRSAARRFACGDRQVAIAHALGVTRAAVSQWHAAWERGGAGALASKGPPGFPSRLTPEKRRELKRIVLRGPRRLGYATDFWTVDRIRDAARKKLRVSLGYTRIWHAVIDLGFSCQKPETRATARDERAITDWKRRTFPRLKKMGSNTRVSPGVL